MCALLNILGLTAKEAEKFQKCVACYILVTQQTHQWKKGIHIEYEKGWKKFYNALFNFVYIVGLIKLT